MLVSKTIGYWNRLSYRCGELRAEGFQLRADVAFSILMSCYRLACQAPFPLAVVLGNVWENKESQLLFLKHAVSSPPEVFTFAHCKKQLECVDHEFQADHATQPWLCLDLLEVLCQLAENGHTASVWSMMEFPLKHCPEVLLLGIAHVIVMFPTPYNLLPHEVAKSVLPMLLEDSSKSGILLRVWGVNPLLLSRALNHVLVLDLENMNKVVDLFQELEVRYSLLTSQLLCVGILCIYFTFSVSQILSSVLDLVPMHLGIKLASLASKKEFVDLVEWLGTNLSAHEDDFYEVNDNYGASILQWTVYDCEAR
uniref:Putative CCR4-NOT transcription complex subunit 1, HEAT repeat protein n=1 Tax=Helianthus annuus TaxID=4232 RepID=A0A251S102_HELAN